ncbi:hypothetical protein CEXT_95441 [Caerostris extrusa]|uniref:Uncharacterized protein n=1 Tax=Caerostris extrusa TaxID=172846 RepID=A0AAV4UWF9_CAEEX|nr:hypothetical protein CEXT_95441 [Caerostris extrusa]
MDWLMGMDDMNAFRHTGKVSQNRTVYFEMILHCKFVKSSVADVCGFRALFHVGTSYGFFPLRSKVSSPTRHSVNDTLASSISSRLPT